MLADAPDWSDRAIAAHVGVDHKTVAAQREAHRGNSPVGDQRTYATKHGTTATMNVSGQNVTDHEKVKKAASAAKQVESDSISGPAASIESDSDTAAAE